VYQVDDEGDKITMNSDEEINEMFDDSNAHIIHFHIEITKMNINLDDPYRHYWILLCVGLVFYPQLRYLFLKYK
jgi:hypothetical protein